MSFRYEVGRVGVDKPRVDFDFQDEKMSVNTEDLIWAATALPPEASPQWVETTDDRDFLSHLEFFDKGRGIIRPALSQYLRASEEARDTKNPQLVRDVNRITRWIESHTQPHYTPHSRMISEEILDMETLEAAIKAEITKIMEPKLALAEALNCSLEEMYERETLVDMFLPDEYARLRRLGYTPDQIPYYSIKVPYCRRHKG